MGDETMRSTRAIAVILFSTGLTGCWPEKDRLIANCEERIAGQLRLPDTYSRKSMKSYEIEIDRMNFVSRELDKYPGREMTSKAIQSIERFDKGERRPRWKFIEITFSASNLYGVSIPSFARCKYLIGDDIYIGTSIYEGEAIVE